MFGSNYFTSNYFVSNYFNGVGARIVYMEVHFNGDGSTQVTLTRVVTYNSDQKDAVAKSSLVTFRA